MKKIVSIIACVMLAACLAGCGSSRTAITTQDFAQRMTAKGFQMADATDQFEAGAVESVTIAVNDNYQIEFYVVPSEEQAASAFEMNKSSFEANKSGSASEFEKNFGNYGYCEVTTGGNYYMTSRVGNTFLYAVVTTDYKEEVKDIVKELGY